MASSLSDNFEDLIANENTIGSYFVTVQVSDFTLKIECELKSAE